MSTKKWTANQAIKMAKKSKYPVFRHGVVIESGGRIITRGCNIKKSVTPSASMSVHAEIAALKALVSKARLKKGVSFNMYVARVSPKNNVVLSMPCPKCMKAIKESGIIDTIYYSTNEGTWEEAVI